MVAAGKANIGDKSKVQHVSANKIEAARAVIKRTLENAIDVMKLSADPAVVIVVGGGSIVNMDELNGVCELIRPQ